MTMTLPLAFAALAGSVSSQSWFAAAQQYRQLPVMRESLTAVVAGDVDGDGDVDLVFACFGRQNLLLLNQGHGDFVDASATNLPVDSDRTNCAVLADLDGDGDLDLVFGNEASSPSSGAQDRLYRNDGSGHFTDATAACMPSVSERTSAMAVGDVDGDGDLDLIAASLQCYDSHSSTRWAGLSRLYLNTGGGVFVDATANRLPMPQSISASLLRLADVDGDQRLDLLVAYGGSLHLLLGTAAGSFVDATSQWLPTLSEPSCCDLGDVDGDGRPDLLLGYPSATVAAQVLLLNSGSGFTAAPPNRLPTNTDNTRTLVLADVDGDTDLDLWVGNTMDQDRDRGRDRLYRNDGTGRFVEAPVPARDGWTRGTVLADLDGDQDLDACSVGWLSQPRLYLGDGAGAFVEAARTAMEGPVFCAGDFDGDGDQDLVGEPGYDQGVRVFWNDGHGMFTPGDSFPLQTSTGWKRVGAAAAADVDGDGDLDVVLALRSGYTNMWLRNDGGVFAISRLFAGSGFDSTSLAVGDVDGDGDLDVVFGNNYGTTGQQNQLFLNSGNGTFALAAGNLPARIDRTIAVHLADVDGDGDLDLLGGDFALVTLDLNDGTGTFSDATATMLPVLPARTYTYGLTTGDIDGDGDLDLFLANSSAPCWLWQNDGTGRFTDVSATALPAAGIDRVQAAAFADLDGDGDLDVALAPNGGTAQLLQNNGGVFVDATSRCAPLVYGSNYCVVVFDADGDGDLDVARGGELAGQLQWNRQRSLETPRVGGLGRSACFELHASGVAWPATMLAVLCVNWNRLSPPLPIPGLGVLQLDPAGCLALSGSFAAAAGPWTVTLIVPPQPALSGARLCAQALVADAANLAELHLSGLAILQLLR